MKQNKMILTYNRPAPVIDDFLPYSTYKCAWERYSLPLGNGFFGANVFGRLGVERIQISDPTLANPYYVPKTKPRVKSCAAGVNNMAELLFHFGHEEAENYVMQLSLDDAVARVEYDFCGVHYTRTVFTSHPDRVMVMRLEASRPASIDLDAELVIPFTGDFCIEEGDGMAKKGSVSTDGDEIIFSGVMSYYGILFGGKMKLITDGGEVLESEGKLSVRSANSVTVIYTSATNYKLSERVFDSEVKHEEKLLGIPAPTELIEELISSAASRGYDALLASHLEDYQAIYDRVKINVGETSPSETTDTVIEKYKEGERSHYLELLLYQFGRYLMISSSRTLLPPHLQGIWNAFADSPWSAGYWHNINLQMNFWSVGTANLSDLFIPYINYAKAYMPEAKKNADNLVRGSYPDKLSPDGENGWIIGTGAWPYKIQGFGAFGHSGPGTGAFTALLFWDYFDYTQDVEFLRDFGYPALRSISVLYSKILTELDGKYLIKDSASPEIEHNGTYYHTVGCAFDQQMVYECFKRTATAAKILGIEDEFVEELEHILPLLDPVLIGDDGQVKEFREETHYASIGEPNHRHISHLVGLYPGTVINESHPEWIEAAKVTLNRRGDKSHGWACAHRLLLWARTGDSRRATDLLQSFVSNNVMENLWDWHPPFQIDGNFGFTAAIGEMLVGGYDGNVRILPALPVGWESGEFSGIVSRGGIVFNCAWQGGVITYLDATARCDTHVNILIPEGSSFNEPNKDGFDLKKGERRVLIE